MTEAIDTQAFEANVNRELLGLGIPPRELQQEIQHIEREIANLSPPMGINERSTGGIEFYDHESYAREQKRRELKAELHRRQARLSTYADIEDAFWRYQRLQERIDGARGHLGRVQQQLTYLQEFEQLRKQLWETLQTWHLDLSLLFDELGEPESQGRIRAKLEQQAQFVQSSIERLETEQQETISFQQKWLTELAELEPDNQLWDEEKFKADPISSLERSQWSLLGRDLFFQRSKFLKVHREQASMQKAEKLLKRKDIRGYLCPALKSVSADAYEIAKVITPVLIGLAAAGTIVIPLIPILFASIALLISRMGIASLCAEYDKKKDDKKD